MSRVESKVESKVEGKADGLKMPLSGKNLNTVRILQHIRRDHVTEDKITHACNEILCQSSGVSALEIYSYVIATKRISMRGLNRPRLQ